MIDGDKGVRSRPAPPCPLRGSVDFGGEQMAGIFVKPMPHVANNTAAGTHRVTSWYDVTSQNFFDGSKCFVAVERSGSASKLYR